MLHLQVNAHVKVLSNLQVHSEEGMLGLLGRGCWLQKNQLQQHSVLINAGYLNIPQIFESFLYTMLLCSWKLNLSSIITPSTLVCFPLLMIFPPIGKDSGNSLASLSAVENPVYSVLSCGQFITILHFLVTDQYL